MDFTTNNPETSEPPQPKPKKRLNRWTVLLFVVLSALFTIFYVSNVMKINGLLKDNQALKKQYNIISNENELLKNKVNELQSPDRIIPLATTKLGMIKAKEAPESLEK